jgi:TonB family protein
MQFQHVVWFLAAATLSGADFGGRWVGAIETNGQPVPLFLTLSHQEGKIVGLVATGSEAKQTPIERPQVEGDQLTFELPDNAGRVVQFRLSMTGGRIVGESTAGGQTSKVGLSRGGGIGAGEGGSFRAPMPVVGSRPGVYRVGGGITAPALIYKTEPEYTEEARAAKFQGTVLLYVEIEPTGIATNIKVQRSLGLGLDQKAVEAVQKWRFKPGMKDSNPVTVQATIEVNFRL